MRKARIKRYQTGGKVEDDDDDLVASNNQAPPLLRAVRSSAPSPSPIARAAQSQGNTTPFPTRSLPSVNPATQIKSSTPVGGNVAVGAPRVIQPNIDPMANARALDTGAVRDAATGFGTGATSVAKTKSYMDANAAPIPAGTRGFNLPSGGYAEVGTPKARPIAPTQSNTQATLAANLPRNRPSNFPQGQEVARQQFVYGGRVDMTPPGNVGFKRPSAFRMGGRVPRFRHGGKVKKMQEGGMVDVEPLQRANFTSNRSDTAGMKHGGKVRKMQSGGSVNDMLNDSPETAFLGTPKPPAPTPTPTPTPRPNAPATTSGPRFIDKVKGIAKAVADREPEKFQGGGRVDPPPKPTPRPPSPSPTNAPTPYPELDEVPEPPPVGNFAANNRIGRFQDGGSVSGIARNTPAETMVQNKIHAPTRHQFKIGGRIYQRGGQIPGKPTGKDTVPAMLSPGEVVLNPKQQKRVVVRPNWQKGLNPKEKSAMASMRLPRARNQRAITGNTVPRIFGGK